MKKILSLALAFCAALTIGFAEDDKGKGKGKGKGGGKAAFFNKLSGDDDSISKEEWLAGKPAQKAKEAGKDPEKGFARLDKDKSGDISKEEFMAANQGGKGKGKGKGGDDAKGKGKGKGGDDDAKGKGKGKGAE